MIAMNKAEPVKPSEDFPLYPHACGKCAKKIRGKHFYFVRCDDLGGALAQYEAYTASRPKAA